MDNHHYDIICVGAGVVGCAAAKLFGSDNRRVLVLERDLSEPDRIVGELMQPGGMEALKKLGLDDCTKGIDGVPCFGYSIYRDGQYIQVPYPSDGHQKAMGMSFHHGRFIQKLRQEAKNTNNVTVMEMSFYAPLTIVADGIFSKFRKEFTELKPDVRSNFVGFIASDLQLPTPDHGFVAIVKPSPVLMYQIGSNETRVLVDVPVPVPSNANDDLKRHLKTNIIPQLPDSLHPSLLAALDSDQPLRTMPNGFLPPFANQSLGVIILGDAMNIRHPLTGGGMTVALQDVLLLQQLINQSTIPDLQASEDLIMQAIDCFHWKRKHHATPINILAMSLYRIFAAGSNPALTQLQKACVGYFQLGGQCLNGPVGLLSGLSRDVFTLIYHFYGVALYAVYQQWCFSDDDVWTCLVKSILLLYTACITIFPYIWSEVKL
ncbi:squalene epoxidase-domain-containing protein [Chlamydoabsidia padenii]|nr:squalene epoxidase-domain-containing protein [Chlamydoabsidia padenii]